MADEREELCSFSTSSWSEWEGTNVDTLEDKELTDDIFDNEDPKNGEKEETVQLNDWASFDDRVIGEKEGSIGDVGSVFKTCFELPVETNEDTLNVERTGPLAVETKFLHKLHKSTVSLTLSSWSHSLIKDHLFLLLLSHGEDNLEQFEEPLSNDTNTLLQLNDNVCITFDWSKPNDKEREEDDDSEEGVSFSPDLMQGLLRPTNGLDSPVEFEFDKDKATLGLSMLTVHELELMRDEMSSKVTKQSDELVTLLQTRDIVIRETDAKNKFIAALLKVQDHKQSSMMSNSHSANNLTTSYNGVERKREERREERKEEIERRDKEGAGERRRTRSRSLTHSLSQNLSRSLSMAWTRSRQSRMSVDERNSQAYLHVVIPYTPLNGTDSYSVPLLKQWIKILKAMADRSPHLPSLVSTYLQTEVISEATAS